MISVSDQRTLQRVYGLTGGKSWEPPEPGHVWIERMIRLGALKRADGVFFYERIRDSHVAWTPLGVQLATEQLPEGEAPAGD